MTYDLDIDMLLQLDTAWVTFEIKLMSKFTVRSKKSY